MNTISISGVIGNAEMKKVGENQLLQFSLAVKKRYSKDKQNDTEWFKCNLWGTRATALEQYLVKGAGVAVTGEMQLGYNPEKKQSYPQVNVDTVDIIKWAEQNQQPKQQGNQYDQFQAIDGDEDIPF